MAELDKSEKVVGDPNPESPVYRGSVDIVRNVEATLDGLEVNASGHHDELQRQYSIWSLCGLALTIDSAWVALGGSLYISLCKLLGLAGISTN
jgi:choline transport protein